MRFVGIRRIQVASEESYDACPRGQKNMEVSKVVPSGGDPSAATITMAMSA